MSLTEVRTDQHKLGQGQGASSPQTRLVVLDRVAADHHKERTNRRQKVMPCLSSWVENFDDNGAIERERSKTQT